MAESFCWRGADVTQQRRPGKAARLTGQSGAADGEMQMHEKTEKNACQRKRLSLN
jgi:hypothetical protein